MAPSISCHSHKGLLNEPGQNNCFLNSAVQVLWHLDIFRRSFRELSGHACMAESCIFCALKELFGQLQFSHERALPPDALRKALAETFSDQHRFQLGCMDDAAECFENILLRIHYHIASGEVEDMCNAKHCIPHQKFAMTLVEQTVCGACNATSEPLPFTQMVHYVSASALISQSKNMNVYNGHVPFGQLLKNAGAMGDIRDCPNSCGAKIQIQRTLMNRPEIVSVGIVWDSDRPSLDHIMSLLDTLQTHLSLSDIFNGCFGNMSENMQYHELVGVVTYYGKHYSTFFFHTKLKLWVYFDDANVKEVGPYWEQVVEKCRRGRYQPLLLLFAVPNATPIDTSNAPKMTVLAPKPAINRYHDHVGKLALSSQRSSVSPTAVNLILGGRRSITPSPEKPHNPGEVSQRRAITPNPEQPSVLPKNEYQNLLQYQEDAVFDNKHNTEEMTLTPDQKKDVISPYMQRPIRKQLIRRDSGNWSGDRNSASSSSSTSLENPYQYILGKLQLNRMYSPKKARDSSSGSNGLTDPGYDSFSLSSTDSLPLQNSVKHTLQLAQIPEGHHTPPRSSKLNVSTSQLSTHCDDCKKLCAEAEKLLDQSEQTEDLATALSLCNAAVNKARAAMDAPYSNSQIAAFARMKHNACVMRARSLHKKLEESLHNNSRHGESRHSREGSGSSQRGGSASHSGQNSKEKLNAIHSRQNSQDLLSMPLMLTHNQKRHTSSSQELLQVESEKRATAKSIEIYATLPKTKKGLLSRSSPKSKNIVEDEEYLMYERPGRCHSKAPVKKEPEKRARSEERTAKPTVKETKKQSKQEEKAQKPAEDKNKKQHKIRRKLLMGGLIRRKNRSMPDLREDDASSKETVSSGHVRQVSKDDTMIDTKVTQNLSGYLSESNLERASNPNLERSKLMRKSFFGNKTLLQKVPPPPPLRTTSQLSKMSDPAHSESQEEPWSLPFISGNCQQNSECVTYANGQMLNQHNTIVTEAQVHHEASFQSLPTLIDNSSSSKSDNFGFPLPPYPSPTNSASHSRQASEEFPPPPSCVAPVEYPEEGPIEHESSTWLRELQAKQAARKVEPPTANENANWESKFVQNLRSKFENLNVRDSNFCDNDNIENSTQVGAKIDVDRVDGAVLKKQVSLLRSHSTADPKQFDKKDFKRKSGKKKKNVTFCEQVVLVATAEEQQADSYIPNPILERVLRSVLHKESQDSKEVTVQSVVPLKRTDSWNLSQGMTLKPAGSEVDVDKTTSHKTPPRIPPSPLPRRSLTVAVDKTGPTGMYLKSNLGQSSENAMLQSRIGSDIQPQHNSSYIENATSQSKVGQSQYQNQISDINHTTCPTTSLHSMVHSASEIPVTSGGHSLVPDSTRSTNRQNMQIQHPAQSSNAQQFFNTQGSPVITGSRKVPSEQFNHQPQLSRRLSNSSNASSGSCGTVSSTYPYNGTMPDPHKYTPVARSQPTRPPADFHLGQHSLPQNHQPMSLRYYDTQDTPAVPPKGSFQGQGSQLSLLPDPYVLKPEGSALSPQAPHRQNKQLGSQDFRRIPLTASTVHQLLESELHKRSPFDGEHFHGPSYNENQGEIYESRFKNPPTGFNGECGESQNMNSSPTFHTANHGNLYQHIPRELHTKQQVAESYENKPRWNSSCSTVAPNSPYQLVPQPLHLKSQAIPNESVNHGNGTSCHNDSTHMAIPNNPYQHIPRTPYTKQRSVMSNGVNTPSSESCTTVSSNPYQHAPQTPDMGQRRVNSNDSNARNTDGLSHHNISSDDSVRGPYQHVPQMATNSHLVWPNNGENGTVDHFSVPSIVSNDTYQCRPLKAYMSQRILQSNDNSIRHTNGLPAHSDSTVPSGAYQRAPPTHHARQKFSQQSENETRATSYPFQGSVSCDPNFGLDPNSLSHHVVQTSQMRQRLVPGGYGQDSSVSNASYQHGQQMSQMRQMYNEHGTRLVNGNGLSHQGNSSSDDPAVYVPYQHIPQTPHMRQKHFQVPQQGQSLGHVQQQSQGPSIVGPYQQVPPAAKHLNYQRPPTPNHATGVDSCKYSPYQNPPPPRDFDTRKQWTLSSPTVPCSLCRKKQISPPAVYCVDCDFYISRFKQQKSCA